jgi:Protein of unknown function (DUF3563)
MSTLIERIKALLPIFKGRRAVDEAYLSSAVDMYDLERRLRLVDRAKEAYARSLAFGTTMP